MVLFNFNINTEQENSLNSLNELNILNEHRS